MKKEINFTLNFIYSLPFYIFPFQFQMIVNSTFVFLFAKTCWK